MKGHRPAHHIERVKLDFEIWEEQDAAYFQNEMSRIFNTYLKKILERLLDQFDSPDYLIQIDKLEVDLGEILGTSMDRKIPRDFEERMHRLLVDVLGRPGRSVPYITGNKVKVSMLKAARLEVLLTFLVSGTVPGNASLAGLSMQEVMQELLEADAKATLEVIQEAYTKSPQVAERIARQFNKRVVEAIYQALLPSYRSYLVSQEEAIVRALSAEMKLSESYATQTVRLYMLQNLFANRSASAFSPHDFRKDIAKRLTQKLGEDAMKVFADVVEDPKTKESGKKDPESLQRRIKTALVMLRRYLSQGMRPDTPNVLLDAWDLLSLEEPTRLAQTIAESKPQPKQLLELVTVLPEVAVEEFMARVSPQGIRLVRLLVAEAVSIYQVYSSPNVDPIPMQRTAMATMLNYVSQIATAGKTVTVSEAAKALSKGLETHKDIPVQLKKVLDEASLPGLSELLKAERARSTETSEERAESPLAQDETPTNRFEQETKRQDAVARVEGGKAFTEIGDITPEQEMQAQREALARADQAFREAAAAKEEQAREVAAVARMQAEVEAEVAKMLEEELEQQSGAKGKKTKDEWAALPPEQRAALEKRRDELIKVRLEDARKKLEEKKKAAMKERKEREELRRLSAAAEQPATAIPLSIQETEEPLFATVAARLDYLEHFLRHGTDPWWVKHRDPMLVELVVTTLSQVDPVALRKMILRLVAGLPDDKLEVVVRRLVERVGGPALQLLVMAVMPEIGGFAGVVREAMEAYVEEPELYRELPPVLASPGALAFVPMLGFVFRYAAGGGSPSNLVRYLVTRVGDLVPAGPRAFIRQLTTVLDKKLAKGDKRFQPFKTMLPLSFMPITVDPPLQPKEAPAPEEATYTEAPDVNLLPVKAEALEQEMVQTQLDEAARVEALVHGREATELEQVEKGELLAKQEVLGESEKQMATKQAEEATKQAEEAAKQAEEAAEQAEEAAKQAEETRRAEEDRLLMRQAFDFGDKPSNEKTEGQKSPKGEKGKKDAKSTPEAKGADAGPQLPAQGELEKAQDQPSAVEGNLEKQVDSQSEGEKGPPSVEDVAAPPIMRWFRNVESAVHVLSHYFKSGSVPGDFPVPVTQAAFESLVEYLILRHPDKVVPMLRTIVKDRQVRQRIVQISPALAKRVAGLLSPKLADAMLPFMEVIVQLLDGFGGPVKVEDVLEHAIAYGARVSGSVFSPLDYMKSLVQYAEQQLGVERRVLVSYLEAQLDRKVLPMKGVVRQVIQTMRYQAPDSSESGVKDEEKKKKAIKKAEAKPIDEVHFVANAGLVLVWPFLPQLFGMLNMLTPDKMGFLDEEKRSRAAHIMDYIVWEEVNRPEEDMFLNKTLLAFGPDDVLLSIDELTEAETNLIKEMMDVVCDRSKIMKTPNVPYLRESYLQREGSMRFKKDKGWVLKVDKKPYDMLMARLGWALSPIKYNWLTDPFIVEW